MDIIATISVFTGDRSFDVVLDRVNNAIIAGINVSAQ